MTWKRLKFDVIDRLNFLHQDGYLFPLLLHELRKLIKCLGHMTELRLLIGYNHWWCHYSHIFIWGRPISAGNLSNFIEKILDFDQLLCIYDRLKALDILFVFITYFCVGLYSQIKVFWRWQNRQPLPNLGKRELSLWGDILVNNTFTGLTLYKGTAICSSSQVSFGVFVKFSKLTL